MMTTTISPTPIIDSHCHLHSLDLTMFDGKMENVLNEAKAHGVEHFLCVCIELDDLPKLHQLASSFPNISISAGIHPNTELNLEDEPSAEKLVALANHPKCIAIGETGLDYYRTTEQPAIHQQQQRFRNHIQAAIHTQKPLIIHTRAAADDTLLLMKEEKADDIGGVMHCFAENWDIAQRALDLNFYISFSGIVTFKNAKQLHEVAKKVPLERMLIETDCPYLAPVPFRGKQNHPALVQHVAQAISELRGIDYATVAQVTTENFYRCFRLRP